MRNFPSNAAETPGWLRYFNLAEGLQPIDFAPLAHETERLNLQLLWPASAQDRPPHFHAKEPSPN